MGLCEFFLPILLNPLTYLGLGGTLVAGKLAYSYSSATFIPSFLAWSNIIRVLGSIASIINLAWNRNLFVYASFYTTFQKTIHLILSSPGTGLRKIAFTAGSELYNKIGLAVQRLVEGIGYINEYLATITSKGVCTGLGQTELLVSAAASFWIGAAAYIFALRIYDMQFGKGMTREVEWPEQMLVVLGVTLFSLLVAMISGVDIFNLAVSNTESLAATLT